MSTHPWSRKEDLLGPCIAIGLMVGLAVGVATGNPVTGFLVGLGVGIAGGLVLEHLHRRRIRTHP